MAFRVKEKLRDARDYDTTQLREGGYGRALNRDYSAHFWRWGFVRRYVKDTDDVLEIGCGQDQPLANILTRSTAGPQVRRYVGVDIHKLRPSSNARLTFLGEFNFVDRHRELQKLQPDGFDVVVHLEVIEHMRVDNGGKLLRACHKLLKPGGLMLMSTPCYDGVHHASNHIHEYTVPELQAATEKAGFEVQRRFGTHMPIKQIGKRGLLGDQGLDQAVARVRERLAEYYDNSALSCLFAPLYPDHARNNVWVCRKRGG